MNILVSLMKKTYTVADRTYTCPILLVHSMFMGKWKGMVVWTLMQHSSLRYGELKRVISISQKISDKVLIETLKELVSDGLLVRTDYKEVPPKVEYALSRRGRALRSIFKDMKKFGEQYAV
jgi:DNA-binding HxlR family transcriptional regulator